MNQIGILLTLLSLSGVPDSSSNVNPDVFRFLLKTNVQYAHLIVYSRISNLYFPPFKDCSGTYSLSSSHIVFSLIEKSFSEIMIGLYQSISELL